MTDSRARILIVDDEEAIRRLLSIPLQKDGHEVVTACDGQQALDMFGAMRIDLVVLDIMMPRVDGMEVCRRMRATSTVPIIMLTARSEEFDKVLGLEIGADDYITKDRLSLREFRSRVRAQLRRAEMARRVDDRQDIVSAGDLEIDLARRAVTVRGERVSLTYVEFELLRVLASHPGRVYSRQLLLQLAWGDSDYRDERTIDVHIRHVREKIETDPRNPEYVFTVRNIGYRFREP